MVFLLIASAPRQAAPRATRYAEEHCGRLFPREQAGEAQPLGRCERRNVRRLMRRRSNATATAWTLGGIDRCLLDRPDQRGNMGRGLRDFGRCGANHFMRLRLAHYRNRFSMFRTYYALRAGHVKADGIDFTVVEVPDPPSRELEDILIRGEVDISNVYLANFLERRLDDAPIVGLCTEWKSTGKGNGLFVRRGEIQSPGEIEGCLVATHQGRHAIHQYLLKRAYAVDSTTLQWIASPQETLIDILRRRDADAVVLLDHFFHHGEEADDIACLYTDGDAWKRLTGFDEMIKHIVAANESLIRLNPGLRDALLAAFRESFAYSERNIN